MDDSDSENEIREAAVSAGVERAWPRFLVVESGDTERPLSRLSPFAIQKGFHGMSSTGITSIKRLRSGSFLVECQTKAASDRLRKHDGAVFVDRKIKVSVHVGLNSSKGVMRCRELADMTEQEIKDNLTSQGVTRVERTFITKDGKRQPTNTLFLTFAMAQLPESVRVGYLKVRVTPFVPSPLRCFKCQHFGHGSRACKAQEICRECGQAKHDGACSTPKHCVNCKGGHASSSKECPLWKKEQEIQKIKTLNKCSFTEAKKKVESSNLTLTKSFTQVVASPVANKSDATGIEAVLSKILDLLTKLSDRMDRLEGISSVVSSGPASHLTTATNRGLTSHSDTVTPSETTTHSKNVTSSGTTTHSKNVKTSNGPTSHSNTVTTPSGLTSQSNTVTTSSGLTSHSNNVSLASRPSGPRPTLPPKPTANKPGPQSSKSRNLFAVLEGDVGEEEMEIHAEAVSLPHSRGSSRASSPSKGTK